MSWMRNDERVLVVMMLMFSGMTNPSADAAVTLAGVFGDHMVLQRDTAAPIWGRASAGEVIRVTFADQVANTLADDAGHWRVTLAPLPASSEPRTLTVTGSTTVTCRDVLVGDVWLASGQSNMWWPVRSANDAARHIAAADHPRLRLFTVTQIAGSEPAADVAGTWAASSPETVADFSAVAYHFGRELHEALDVPIGVIHASVRGTAIEMWMSRAALEAQAHHTPVLKAWQVQLSKWSVERYPSPDHHAADYWAAMTGFYGRYMERWQQLKDAGEPDPRKAMTQDMLKQFDENKRLELLLKNDMPSAFYHGMIAPLAPAAIRGVIWYQGETNALRDDVTIDRYEALLGEFIHDWRGLWQRDDLPWLLVGLANFEPRKAHQFKGGLPLVREAQRRVSRRVPHVGLANIIDLGDPNNIHAGNKLDVGKRLASVALHQVYGHDVASSGPTVSTIERTGARLVVRFDHAEGGLVVRGDEGVTGFAVAGPDGQWHDATATVDGMSVLLSSSVAQPAGVRFAWQDNPSVALYNRAGLPAVPFHASVP